MSRYIIRQSQERLVLTYNAEMGADGFTDILDQICGQEFHLVLLIDMFDEIVHNKYIYQILAFLRAHATIGKVSYVTASIASLHDICHYKIADSPFFNIFYNYSLEALASEEALELITALAQQADKPLTNSEVKWVLHYAGRHSFFIDRICFVLFEEKQQLGSDRTDERQANNEAQSDNSKVIEQRIKNIAYKDLLPHFTDIWERLSEEQRKQLQDEAQLKKHEIRELPELSESAFYRQFVRKTCRIELFQMTVDELEDALKKINDPKALGETNLRLMRAASPHLRKETTPTSVERGIAIREVLNEAFEGLRGPGVRSDSAHEWKLYNILYYRYFRYHLKNEHIAARLEFSSDRQFFRERAKAIEALRNNLVEIEMRFSSDE